MNNPQVLFYSAPKHGIIKIVGELRFNHSNLLTVALAKVKDNLINSDLVIDVTEATLLDSTILGILAGTMFEYHEMNDHKKPQVFYQEDEVKQLFTQIGLLEFADFRNENHRILTEQDLQLVSAQPSDESDLKQNVLQAHKNLNKLNQNLLRIT